MDKTYSPKDIEAKWYSHWEESGVFTADPAAEGEPYAVIMPPPNVTGNLHMGHALDNTLQDVLVRFERLRGKNVLWQPGTDHAGIATQMVVERLLDSEGKRRADMGREKFLERVWQWKEESGGAITQQLRRLGASCDWSREAFTMDDPRQRAVSKKFVTLYRDGLIYRDKRLVNWDPKLKTAISDLEVEQKEVDGNYWHLRYPVEGMENTYITVATTRPETMLGDTAVAVHPDDARYKDLVGKEVRLPLVGRLIPIIADEYADPEQGSGAVKITPAHDFNDFEVGKRHGLPMINVLDADAHITGDVPEKYRGMERFEARKAIVADFEAAGLLADVVATRHMVPYGDRGGVVIEPWLTDQWYVDAATMAAPAIKAVEDGRTRFVPENWTKTYYEWMRNIQPWCVSRQLWWGHQIPAWYAPDGSVFVAETEEEARTEAEAKLGEGVTLTRDEDVLDTWFSSAMWPYSTLGWPEQTDALKTWYPSATLVTGFDIIFFWVARMMMSGMHFMDGEVPFKTVYIHALVRDEKGAKMSKSKGNVIDPLLFIDKYGADALRFTLTSMEAQGRDIKLAESRVEGYRNFGTKLWNAARFCEMNGIRGGVALPENVTHGVNHWILAELNKAIAGVTKGLEAYRFNEASDAIYHFIWGTFCDWYLELIKPIFFDEDEALKAETRLVAGYVLDRILVLLHPFMPFITEEIWNATADARDHDLIAARWPSAVDVTAESARAVDFVIRFVSDIRSMRAEMNVPAGARATALMTGTSSATAAIVAEWQPFLCRLARMERVACVDAAESAGAAQIVMDEGVVYVPLADLMDIEAEKARLAKNLTKLEKEAAGLRGRLGNEAFLAKAPEHVVIDARAQLADLDASIEKTSGALKRLG